MILNMSVEVDVAQTIDAVKLNFVFKIVQVIMIVCIQHVVQMGTAHKILFVKEIKKSETTVIIIVNVSLYNVNDIVVILSRQMITIP